MTERTSLSARPSRERVSAPAGVILPTGPPPRAGGDHPDNTFPLRVVGLSDGSSGFRPLPLPVGDDLEGDAA